MVRKGVAKLYVVMQGLLKKRIIGVGETWWNFLVWPIPNGELEGMGGVTDYMDGILVMGTSHSREVLMRIEQFGFKPS